MNGYNCGVVPGASHAGGAGALAVYQVDLA
jgi:hypothetical protein